MLNKKLLLIGLSIFLLTIFSSIIIFSLGTNTLSERSLYVNENSTKIMDLSDAFYWAESDAASTIYSTSRLKFKKLNTHESQNLMKLCGTEGKYIWLKAEFEIPPVLKYRSLGFLISYLHFADKVWLNNVYVGSYGKFPPNEKSTFNISRCYFFPENALNNEGTNTILMKVWTHGRAEISDLIFISDYDTALGESNKITFWNSKIYLIFTGAMFCAFILYFLMFIFRRKEKENLAFALLNLSTTVFLIPFYAAGDPFYNSDYISFLLFMKLTLCISFYCMITLTSYFIIKILHVEIKKITKIAMASLIIIPSIVTLLIPTYNALMKAWPIFILMMMVQLGIGIFKFFQAIRIKIYRKNILAIITGFTPILITLVIDFVLRFLLNDTSKPYFSMFGWQLTIVSFILMLSLRYNEVYSQYEYLNNQLEKEVTLKTKTLTDINEHLESEKKRNDIDLEMASIVQQKFFPYPTVDFKGWDVAICYNPVSKVSGDLYDYYHNDSDLQGFSLFDVSGHGIAASLITMLSKNIVYRAFRDSIKNNKSVSQALYRVNQQIIEAKGEIENYLTGILLRFSDFDENNVCKVEMANAGHPHPIFYSAESKCSVEIVHAHDQYQYGAIGIRDIEVSFPTIKFNMGINDIFICFTDGLTESMNKNREEFGKERVMDILNNCADKNAQDILIEIKNALYEFTKDTPRDDDLTIIILKRCDANILNVEEFEELESSLEYI